MLPVLRDPKLTLTTEQLAEKTPLEWFKEGKLGMIAGFRDLVPELRPTATLDFDILPMPVVDDPATVGDLTGICISRDSPDIAESADFLVNFISTESVSSVAAAGYLAPANTTVALSEAFLQPGSLPLHSGVSNNSIKNMRTPPLIDNFAELEAAVAEPLRALLEVEVPDLDALTQQIDDASVPVLAPPEETESPSEESSVAAALLRPLTRDVLAVALEGASIQDDLVGVMAAPLLDVAVVGRLARDLAHVPAHTAAGAHHGRRGGHDLSAGA